jgi:hypothetical protein
MAEPNARQRLAATVAGAVQDGAALAGAGLITYGASQVYHPAGFIVGGIFMLAGAWRLARKSD